MAQGLLTETSFFSSSLFLELLTFLNFRTFGPVKARIWVAEWYECWVNGSHFQGGRPETVLPNHGFTTWKRVRNENSQTV